MGTAPQHATAPRRATADAVVIGGGVIGTSVAYRLAERGRRVILVEKSDLASGASGACDKAIFLQSKNPGLHLELALASAAMYEGLAEELGSEIEFRRDGAMIAIETPADYEVMTKFAARQREAGLRVQLLSGDEARKIQPALAPHIAGATWSDQDAEVNPMLLTFALARAARRHGAEIFTNSEVTGIRTRGGRVTAVVTNRGEISTDLVINACGAWAPHVAEMVGLDIPIKPRRGQIIITERVPPMIHGDMLCARYIVAKYNPDLLKDSSDPAVRLGVGLSLGQTASGNLLIGGCREFVGYDRRNTEEALRAIVNHATRIVPRLRGIHVIRTFAGLRPYTPDGLPILGESSAVKGFFMAAGHEGDGIALAPITGRIVADLVDGNPTGFPAERFGPERFLLTA